jgi:hypothetical protein
MFPVAQTEGIRIEGSSITWAPRPELVLPWRKTKTRRDRRIPISSRLRSILEMRRFDPAGQPLPAEAYVFGNTIGQRIKDIGRAWETAVLKSHGHTVRLSKTCNLTPRSTRSICIFTICDGKPGVVGSRAACRSIRSAIGSATRRSPRQAPISPARCERSMTR